MGGHLFFKISWLYSVTGMVRSKFFWQRLGGAKLVQQVTIVRGLLHQQFSPYSPFMWWSPTATETNKFTVWFPNLVFSGEQVGFLIPGVSPPLPGSYWPPFLFGFELDFWSHQFRMVLLHVWLNLWGWTFLKPNQLVAIWAVSGKSVFFSRSSWLVL